MWNSQIAISGNAWLRSVVATAQERADARGKVSGQRGKQHESLPWQLFQLIQRSRSISLIPMAVTTRQAVRKSVPEAQSFLASPSTKTKSHMREQKGAKKICSASIQSNEPTQGRRQDGTMKEAVRWQGTRALSSPYEQEGNEGKKNNKLQLERCRICTGWTYYIPKCRLCSKSPCRFTTLAETGSHG